MKDTNELLNKYFDKIINISSFKYIDVSKYFFEKVLLFIKSADFLDSVKEKMISDLHNSKKIIEVHLVSKIKTVRNFNYFLRQVFEDLNNFQSSINTGDIVLLAIIRNTNITLSNIIERNPLLFVEESLKQKNYYSMFYLRYNEIMEEKISKINSILNENGIKDDGFEFLKDLFLNLASPTKNDHSFVVNRIVEDNRISHPYLFEYYFSPLKLNEVEKYIFKAEGKAKLLHNLQNQNYEDWTENDKQFLNLKKEISKFLPSGDAYQDIRKQVIVSFRKLVAKEPLNISKNLIFLLSYCAKNLSNVRSTWGLSDKFNLACSILDYVKREDADIKFLVKLITHFDNSDEFSTTMILFLVSNDGYENFKHKTKYIIDSIFISFEQRLKTKLQNAESIFDESVFDDSLEMIFRWKNMEDFFEKNNKKQSIEKISDYMIKLFKETPTLFVNFVNYFTFWGTTVEIQKEQFLPIISILHQDKIVELINYYKESGLYKDFDENFMKNILQYLVKE